MMTTRKKPARQVGPTPAAPPAKKERARIARPAEVEGATRDAANGNEEALTELAKW